MLSLHWLEIENINSLAGKHRFDFDGLKAQGPIFLFRGDTGSGKSTVLDGLTIALFGQTPRLKNLTKTENPALTLGQSHCSATLSLSINGQEYTAFWGQGSTKKGGLKAPQAWLKKGEELVAEGSRAVTGALKDLGLEVDSFTQTVLLPQGKWDTFLRSDDKARAELLETLTGSQWASQVSALIYQKAKAQKEELDAAKLRCDQEDRALLVRRRDRLKSSKALLGVQRDRLKEQKETLDQEMDQAKKRRELCATLEEKGHKQRQLGEEQQAFCDLEEPKLRRYEALGPVMGLSQELDGLQAQASSMKEELAKAEEKKETLQADLDVAERHVQEASQAYDRAQRLAELSVRLEAAAGRLERQQEREKDWLDKKETLERQYAAALQKAEQARVQKESADRELLKAQEEEERELKDLAHQPLILDLLRSGLQPGHSCPLCGALVTSAGLSLPVGELALDGWKDAKETLNQATQKAARCDEAYESAKRTIDERQKDMSELNCRSESGTSPARLEHMKRSIQTLRDRALGLRKRGAEAQQALQRAQDGLNKARDAVQKERTAVAELQGQLKSLERLIEAKDLALEEAKKALTPEWAQQLTALRPGDLISAQEAALLTQRQAELIAGLKSLAEEIARLTKQRDALPLRDEATLAGQQEVTDGRLAKVLAKAGAIDEQLREAERRIGQGDEARRHYEELKKDFEPLSQLNSLMGQADGGKLNKIVQSLNFGLLVEQANTLLAQFAPRYRLMLSPGSFELCVADGHMNGLTRSARNLSGGESFLVALSLALALRQWRTNQACDMLFVDEGFGSLDQDSLKQAREVLSRLAPQGGSVVLISHVEALAETIPGGYHFTRKKDGTSTAQKEKS